MLNKTLSHWLDHMLVLGPLRRVFQNPRRILRRYVQPGFTVLDVGCGEGYFSFGMARMVGSTGRVICVDVETEAIEAVTEQGVRCGLSERMDLRLCTDRCLGISDLANQVDFALAFYVVHHAADAHQLFSDVYGALKPSGRLLVVEPSHHSSVRERQQTETAARNVGFELAPGPRLLRDWTILLTKT